MLGQTSIKDIHKFVFQLCHNVIIIWFTDRYMAGVQYKGLQLKCVIRRRQLTNFLVAVWRSGLTCTASCSTYVDCMPSPWVWCLLMWPLTCLVYHPSTNCPNLHLHFFYSLFVGENKQKNICVKNVGLFSFSCSFVVLLGPQVQVNVWLLL